MQEIFSNGATIVAIIVVLLIMIILLLWIYSKSYATLKPTTGQLALADAHGSETSYSSNTTQGGSGSFSADVPNSKK